MKIEKLPSGSYRMRKTYKGKTYTVVTEYEPTQKEALKLMAAELDRVQAQKSNVLSPSTIRMYKTIARKLTDNFTGMLLSDITAYDIQKEINIHAKDKSPKTIRNYHGFISAVITTFSPDTVIKQPCRKNAKLSHIFPQTRMLKPYSTCQKAVSTK